MASKARAAAARASGPSSSNAGASTSDSNAGANADEEEEGGDPVANELGEPVASGPLSPLAGGCCCAIVYLCLTILLDPLACHGLRDLLLSRPTPLTQVELPEGSEAQARVMHGRLTSILQETFPFAEEKLLNQGIQVGVDAFQAAAAAAEQHRHPRVARERMQANHAVQLAKEAACHHVRINVQKAAQLAVVQPAAAVGLGGGGGVGITGSQEGTGQGEVLSAYEIQRLVAKHCGEQ